MALPITILKNVLNLNLMHVEKCEEAVTTYQAYGETYEQPSIFVHARPFKRSQCRCPVCKKPCVMNGHKLEEESKWRASNLNGRPVYILYRPQRILCVQTLKNAYNAYPGLRGAIVHSDYTEENTMPKFLLNARR